MRTVSLCKAIQEGLAVASIARDDPSTLPGDDPLTSLPACTATAMRVKLGSEFEI